MPTPEPDIPLPVAPPPTRLVRTAWIVQLCAWPAAGLLYLQARLGYNPDLREFHVLSGTGLGLLVVGFVWSNLLALRGVAGGERPRSAAALLAFSALQLIAIGVYYWTQLQQNREFHPAMKLGVPAFFPALGCAVLAGVLAARFFLRREQLRPNPSPGAAMRRAAWVALPVFLLLVPLPLVVLSSFFYRNPFNLMRAVSSDWRAKVVEHAPAPLFDAALKILPADKTAWPKLAAMRDRVAGTGRCDPRELERIIRSEQSVYALVGLWAQDRAAAARISEDELRASDAATVPPRQYMYPILTILLEERPSAELAELLRDRSPQNRYLDDFIPALNWSQPHDDKTATRVRAVVSAISERELNRKLEEAVKAAQSDADKASGTTGARGNGPSPAPPTPPAGNAP